MQLAELLKTTFGFPAFRANQEAVCRATTDGKDVLLVMPTGAGKSLCYQLPAIARGGTGLVISPLIALMDDQAGKLTQAGLRVARIHSGLSREDSRQACRDYLDGKLQFLFIAPERMRVPGFPEMLARRKPSLIAIDEAHCISAWGHDFRPDYRMLGDHLPALRPAPIIALTATATPAVQKDIVTQLNLQQPALFIHGFRRDNLSIEVVELAKPRRQEFTANFLADKTRRPAIVYAPSRKAAEELAQELSRHFPAAAYHAGLEPSVRERVQRNFQIGKLEVVVATIAFGMGIDKADVRTVIHFALPASVEAYYQEIGRAGRDGQQSRTILLYSFVDRKIHDGFLDRDYPVVNDLVKVSSRLTDEFLMPEYLASKLRMPHDIVIKSLEKLASHGAAQFDMAGLVRAGSQINSHSWKSGYEQQVQFRRTQIDRMMQFAETQQCRMTALIRHFGDTADAHRPCGHCDFCSPHATTAQSFAEPTQEQERDLRTILRTLSGGVSKSTGKLHTELNLTADRKVFDALLDGLARAGLIALTAETFTNPEGKVIPYKKVTLTFEGSNHGEEEPLGVVLTAAQPASSGKSKSKKSGSRRVSEADTPLTPAQQSLEENLRAWRKDEAAKTGKPAFIVASDAALKAVAIARPQNLSALLAVSGFGPDKTERYGAAITALCRNPSAKLASLEEDVRPKWVSQERPDSDPIDSSWEDLLQAEPSNSQTTTPQSRATQPAALKVRAPLPQVRQPRAAGISVPQPRRTPAQLSPATSPRISGAPFPQTFQRERPAPFPGQSFTPDQLALEQRLRDWRKAESERMGLPQFFVLGTTSLRSIVLERPTTLAELGSINGIDPDKINRFGPSILAVCNEA